MIDLYNKKETSKFNNFTKENASRNADELYIWQAKRSL